MTLDTSRLTTDTVALPHMFDQGVAIVGMPNVPSGKPNGHNPWNLPLDELLPLIYLDQLINATNKKLIVAGALPRRDNPFGQAKNFKGPKSLDMLLNNPEKDQSGLMLRLLEQENHIRDILLAARDVLGAEVDVVTLTDWIKADSCRVDNFIGWRDRDVDTEGSMLNELDLSLDVDGIRASLSTQLIGGAGIWLDDDGNETYDECDAPGVLLPHLAAKIKDNPDLARRAARYGAWEGKILREVQGGGNTPPTQLAWYARDIERRHLSIAMALAIKSDGLDPSTVKRIFVDNVIIPDLDIADGSMPGPGHRGIEGAVCLDANSASLAPPYGPVGRLKTRSKITKGDRMAMLGYRDDSHLVSDGLHMGVNGMRPAGLSYQIRVVRQILEYRMHQYKTNPALRVGSEDKVTALQSAIEFINNSNLLITDRTVRTIEIARHLYSLVIGPIQHHLKSDYPEIMQRIHEGNADPSDLEGYDITEDDDEGGGGGPGSSSTPTSPGIGGIESLDDGESSAALPDAIGSVRDSSPQSVALV
jgi:hypothetical protein